MLSGKGEEWVGSIDKLLKTYACQVDYRYLNKFSTKCFSREGKGREGKGMENETLDGVFTCSPAKMRYTLLKGRK